MTSDAQAIDPTEASFAIQLAITQGAYDEVIARVRDFLTADRVAAMADPVVAEWIAQRYRNIFLDEATASPDALAHAGRRFPMSFLDRRDDRERVAERFFRHIDPEEIHREMPRANADGFADTTLLFAPGLITGYMPTLAFQTVFPQMVERFGVKILSADSHPVRSSEANVADLVNAMENGIGNAPDPEGTLLTAEDHPTPPGDVVLMGYSKGAPDISTFLVARPDLVPRVRAVVSWAGAHGGSPLANDMYHEVSAVPNSQLADQLAEQLAGLAKRFFPFPDITRLDRRLDEYDVKGALYSLTTMRREEFNSEHTATLQSYGIPTIYFTGSTSAREVAYFNRSGEEELHKLDPYNDMQLTQAEATPPTAHAVHPAMFHANHWDLSYDTWPWYKTMGSRELQEPFTRYSAMSSILLLCSELGLMT